MVDYTYPMGGYSYRPLQKTHLTRIIILEPGSANDVLRFTLREIVDWKVPGYSALSWCWGDAPIFNVPIVCEGHEYSISLSLVEALCRFRSPSEDTNIWVDAICINQNDEDEKSVQVIRMRDIYSQATQVKIWVGPENEDSHLVVRLLEAHRKKHITEFIYNVSSEFKHDAPEWPAMVQWLHQPWFWRVWTIQEARLAKTATVYFGPHSIELEVVDKVMSLHVVKDQNQGLAEHLEEAFRSPGLSVRLSLWRTIVSGGPARTSRLFHLLLSSRRHKATDSRDKVYALLGLAKEFMGESSHKMLITPDYKNKTTEEVYRDTAMFLIKHDRSLDVLHAVSHDETFDSSSKMPSWVPRWDRSDGPTILGERSYWLWRDLSRRNDWGVSTSCRTTEDNKTILMVKGSLGKPVRTVMPIMRTCDLDRTKIRGPSTVYDNLWQPIREAYKSPTYIDGRDLIMIFIETLTAGLNQRGESSPRREAFIETLHWMWGHLKGFLADATDNTTQLSSNSSFSSSFSDDEDQEYQRGEDYEQEGNEEDTNNGDAITETSEDDTGHADEDDNDDGDDDVDDKDDDNNEDDDDNEDEDEDEDDEAGKEKGKKDEVVRAEGERQPPDDVDILYRRRANQYAPPDQTPIYQRRRIQVLPGCCEICTQADTQGGDGEQDSHDSKTSLHSYLTGNLVREALPRARHGDCYGFNHLLRNFFNSHYDFERPNLNFLAPCIDACNFRRLFITADQRIGLGPQAMRENDMVVHFAGMANLSVLRRVDADETILPRQLVPEAEWGGEFQGHFHYLGECYIGDLQETSVDSGGDATEIFVFGLV